MNDAPVLPTAVPPDAAPVQAGDAGAGLTSAEAARRLAADGPNALPGGPHRNWLSITRDTLREPMFLLLLAAGSLYLLLGDLREGVTLFLFVLLIMGLTLFQEGRTERAIEALRELTSPRALVVRDGRAQRVPGREVVRGDLLKLSEGDRVPADALLIAGDGLRADESLLTGEAVPVGKRRAIAAERVAGATLPHPPGAAAGGDDRPMVFAGTLIVQGSGLALVMATGVRSEIGRIGASLAGVTPEPSPLQRQTARLVRHLALLALTLSLGLVVVQSVLHGDGLQALLAGIALAMAILPEEYPVVMAVFPALGARRLARDGVLTRRINAIETLGATTVLCSDKTGTLTENRMTVTHLLAGGTALPDRLELATPAPQDLPDAFRALVEVAILASVVDAFDPMEKAFHRLGAQCLSGTGHLHPDWRLVRTYPLGPQLRAMAHVWAPDASARHAVAAKGAPEAVMDLCRLDAARRRQVAAEVDRLAATGLRVLAVARARFDGRDWPATAHGFEFGFVGLLGLADPVRTEVPAAVAECHAAGIRVVMVTGDYPATARAIAAQAGLAAHADDARTMLTGDELDRLDDGALRERMDGVGICARISPAQKLRIVQALKARGEVVAMTGDGVNDAPALRAAHVGVAMGARGTDVARESAALVLVDDNFAAIVRAVRVGRRIFDNLRKAMSYLLAVHVPIAGMALVPVLIGWPALLLPMHIALLEAIIDPACSIAFENEPDEPDVMRRPPRDASAPLFPASTLWAALLQGLGVLVAVLGGYAWVHDHLTDTGSRAFAFTTLVVGNLTLILSSRSTTRSLVHALTIPNRALWVVVALALGLLLLAMHLPWAAAAFRLSPLPLPELLLAGGLGVLGVVWFEGVKWWRRRGRG